MKNNQYTTIAQSRKLLDLGFQSYTASAKYTPLSTDPDKMSVTFSSPEDDLSIPAWTVGDLIDSLPVHIFDEHDKFHNLKISPANHGWEVSYGTAFASTCYELIDALFEANKFVFSKWNIRTRKDFHHSFFKSGFNAFPTFSEEEVFYQRDVFHRIESLINKYNFSKCLGVVHEMMSSLRRHNITPSFMSLTVNRERAARLLKEGRITKDDYRLALNISDEQISDLLLGAYE